MPDWAHNSSRIFAWLFSYKIFSIAFQMYVGSLVGANASAENPWMSLRMIAHLTAASMMFRGIDALIDPAFQKLNPLKKLTEDEKTEIAKETTV